MKKRTSIIIGVFFIILMFGSTIAYTLLTALRTEEQKVVVSLPTEPVVNGELKKDVENLALSKGITVVKLYYNALCTGCQEQRQALETVTNVTAAGQIILEELTDNSVNAPKVSMKSQKGSNELVNATNSAVFDSLCELMLQPPLDCVKV